MTSKYITKIKGAAEKNGDFGGTCEQGLTRKHELWNH